MGMPIFALTFVWHHFRVCDKHSFLEYSPLKSVHCGSFTMKGLQVLMGILFNLILHFENYSCTEPCDAENHQEIDDPSRSTSNVWKPGTKANCDSHLAKGWYRFMNGEMPTERVDVNHCGTQAPIWMKGALPNTVKITEDRIACINFFNIFNGCYQSLLIKVRNCGGFFVYYLKPPFGCPIAYCAGRCELDPSSFFNLILISSLCMSDSNANA